MFIHNYLFLQRFVKELQPLIDQKTLHSIWGLGMDELIVDIQQESYLKFSNCGGKLLYTFCDETYVPSSKHKPRFRHLWGNQIDNLFQKKFDRVWGLKTKQGNTLYFTSFGRFSNILLFKKEETKVSEVFRYTIKKDLELTKKDLNKSVLPGEENQLVELTKLQFLPNYFIHKHSDKTSLSIKDLRNLSFEFSDNMRFRLVENKDGNTDLEPVCSEHDNNIPTAIEAVDAFFKKYVHQWHFKIEKESLVKSLKARINKKSTTLKKIKERVDFLKNSRPDSELADIIMSGLHMFKNDIQIVTLHDFYNNEELTITIPKDTKPVAYAEKLYKKQAGRKGEIERLEREIPKMEEELFNLNEQLDTAETTLSGKGLRKLKSKEISDVKEKLLPFHVHIVSGYTIQIGRNAKGNDDMLRRYSGKNDLWFHAKDVSGSHVIIRRNDNITVPEFVIEKAASLAAYFSKLRNQSLVPVMFTERKYVRKAKGLPAGQVFVDKEKVILVKPEKE
jgi:predicted ribosome quality control (RQC) complex YloA/Tae2 family protein